MKIEPREGFLEALSQRTYNALKRNTNPNFFKSFSTKEELIALLETDGIYSRNFGEKALKELEGVVGFELVIHNWKILKKGARL